MKVFTATIKLNEDQEYVLRESATFFGMDVQSFLDAALWSGVAHAEELATPAIVGSVEHGDQALRLSLSERNSK